MQAKSHPQGEKQVVIDGPWRLARTAVRATELVQQRLEGVNHCSDECYKCSLMVGTRGKKGRKRRKNSVPSRRLAVRA